MFKSQLKYLPLNFYCRYASWWLLLLAKNTLYTHLILNSSLQMKAE